MRALSPSIKCLKIKGNGIIGMHMPMIYDGRISTACNMKNEGKWGKKRRKTPVIPCYATVAYPSIEGRSICSTLICNRLRVLSNSAIWSMSVMPHSIQHEEAYIRRRGAELAKNPVHEMLCDLCGFARKEFTESF